MRIFQIRPGRPEVSEAIKEYFRDEDTLKHMVDACADRAIEESRRTGEHPIKVVNRWLRENE